LRLQIVGGEVFGGSTAPQVGISGHALEGARAGAPGSTRECGRFVAKRFEH
jgi:hypothetical protein